MNEEEGIYDVVVVGAGLSGLTAAYRLLQHDRSLRILILEAKGMQTPDFLQWNSCQNHDKQNVT